MLAGTGAYERINGSFHFATSTHIKIQDGCVSCHTHHVGFQGEKAYTGHEFKPIVEACRRATVARLPISRASPRRMTTTAMVGRGSPGRGQGAHANLSNTIVDATPADSTADRAALAGRCPPARTARATDSSPLSARRRTRTQTSARQATTSRSSPSTQSKGVHNATYAIQLLQQSILYLNPGKLEHAKILVE